MIAGIGLVVIFRGSRWEQGLIFVLGVSVVFAGVSYAIIHFCSVSENLPQTMYPGSIITRPWDVGPLLLYLIAATIIFPTFYRKNPSVFSHSMLVSLIPQIATQLYMSFGSSALFDSNFNIAHVLKILAYFVPFVGLSLDYLWTYRGQMRIRALMEEEERGGRIRAEEDLEQAVKDLKRLNIDLELRNKELDEFSYVASHDLQEPLRKLTSFTNLLVKDLGEVEWSDNAKRDIQYIQDASSRMKVLVQDLLALSRSGRSALNITLQSIDRCTETAIRDLSMKIEEKEAEVVKDELGEARVDRTLMTQLYANLISNAIKFSGEGPPRIHLTAEIMDNTKVYGVRDSGIGIEPEYVQQVFEPFKRLHGRGEFEGTGIGLAICRKVIERHGGRIWVESEPGKGSHFKFTIGTSEEEERNE